MAFFKQNPQSALVVIGASQGGMSALVTLLGGLAADFPWPVVIVQHRSKDAGSELCQILQALTGRTVAPAQDKRPILPTVFYVAPPDYHLLIEEGHFALSLDAPVNCARPSIDVLFESAAKARGSGVCAVVLTGTSDDGARGAAHVKACGGYVIVQDPATAEARVMPDAALAATPDAHVLPLAEISRFLNAEC
jgi:two-component system, chemotaxis family, protein-glutamate methylesterase/glutaminase